jgi:hypothetical protein
MALGMPGQLTGVVLRAPRVGVLRPGDFRGI